MTGRYAGTRWTQRERHHKMVSVWRWQRRVLEHTDESRTNTKYRSEDL